MNKLIIIGNGFDLAHGLPTRYEDFLLWYLNKRLKEPNDYSSNSLLTVYSNRPTLPNYNSLSNFFIDVSANSFTLDYNFDFFKNLIIKSQSNWVDIELEYFQELKNSFKLYEKSNSYDKSQLVKLNKCIELIKIELEEYLNEINKTKITLHQGIVDYLESELSCNKISDNGMLEKGFEKTVFLVFNYTSFISHYIYHFHDTNVWFNFIHGRLHDPNNPLVFGYGDETDSYFQKIEDLNDNEFTKHFKSISYTRSSNYQELFNFLESDEFEVTIIGHSCGVSDRVLLSSVFEHEKNRRIKILYHKKSDTENDFTEKIQEISRHFRPALKHKMRLLIEPFNVKNGI